MISTTFPNVVIFFFYYSKLKTLHSNLVKFF
nr:MAG TPA: hypothetical protein [Caudoviricetes sp.]